MVLGCWRHKLKGCAKDDNGWSACRYVFYAILRQAWKRLRIHFENNHRCSDMGLLVQPRHQATATSVEKSIVSMPKICKTRSLKYNWRVQSFCWHSACSALLIFSPVQNRTPTLLLGTARKCVAKTTEKWNLWDWFLQHCNTPANSALMCVNFWLKIKWCSFSILPTHQM